MVSALAECREPWRTEIVRLFTSLRALGGDLASASTLALFTGQPDEETKAALHALHVEVAQTTPFDPRCPHANKLRILEYGESADWLLAIDTDVLFTGDLGNEFRGLAIRARVVDLDPLNLEQWRRVFEYFGLALPSVRLRTTSTGRKTVPYFNSGAVLVPAQLRETLRDSWSYYVTSLLQAYPALGDVADHAFYTDQLAFALAVAAERLPVDPLPVDVNTPTHLPIHWRWRPRSIRPRLVHYHHMVEADGAVRGSAYSGVDAAVSRANAKWLSHVGVAG